MFVVTYTTYIDGHIDGSGISSKSAFAKREDAVSEMKSWTSDDERYDVVPTSDDEHMVLVYEDNRVELEVVELKVK